MILGPLPKMAAPSPAMTQTNAGAAAPTAAAGAAAGGSSASSASSDEVNQLRSELMKMQMMVAEKTSKEREMSMRLATSEKLKTQYAQMASAMFSENATLKMEQKRLVSEAEARAKEAASQSSSGKGNRASVDQSEEVEKLRASEKELRDQVARKNSELEIADKEVQQSKKQLEDLQRVLTDTQKKVVELQMKQDLVERMQKEFNGGSNNSNSTEQNETEWKAKVSGLESKVTALEAKIKTLEKEKSDADNARIVAERDKADAEHAKAVIEREKNDAFLAKSDAERAKANAELARSDAERALRLLQEQFDKMQPAAAAPKAETDEASKQQLADALARASELEAAYMKAKSALETFSGRFKELRAELEEEKAKNAKLMVIVPALKQQLDEQRKRADEAEQNNVAINSRVERLVALLKARRQQQQPPYGPESPTGLTPPMSPTSPQPGQGEPSPLSPLETLAKQLNSPSTFSSF